MRFQLEKELSERIGYETIETDLKWYEGEKATLFVNGEKIERRVYFKDDLYVWLKGYKVFYCDTWN